MQYKTWQDISPEANPGAVDITGRSFVITNSVGVIFTIAGEALTAGIIDFYCLWTPLSATGNVAAV